MSFTKDEIENLSHFLLSADENSVTLALSTLEGQAKPPLEVAYLYKLGDGPSQEIKNENPKEAKINKHGTFGQRSTECSTATDQQRRAQY